MNLTNLIKSESIEQNLTYSRNGQEVVVRPSIDCAIDSKANEITQLQKISGHFYFYGTIKAEISELKVNAKNDLTYKKAAAFLSGEEIIKKANPKARITDKILENYVNGHEDVQEAKSILAKLEKHESKLEIILKALLLKEEALIEVSRRNKQEINLTGKALNHLG